MLFCKKDREQYCKNCYHVIKSDEDYTNAECDRYISTDLVSGESKYSNCSVVRDKTGSICPGYKESKNE